MGCALICSKPSRIPPRDGSKDRQRLQIIASVRRVIMVARPQIDLAGGKAVIRVRVRNLSENRAVECLSHRNDAGNRRDEGADLVVRLSKVELHAVDWLTRPVHPWRISLIRTAPGRDQADVGAGVASLK